MFHSHFSVAKREQKEGEIETKRGIMIEIEIEIDTWIDRSRAAHKAPLEKVSSFRMPVALR